MELVMDLPVGRTTLERPEEMCLSYRYEHKKPSTKSKLSTS